MLRDFLVICSVLVGVPAGMIAALSLIEWTTDKIGKYFDK